MQRRLLLDLVVKTDVWCEKSGVGCEVGDILAELESWFYYSYLNEVLISMF